MVASGSATASLLVVLLFGFADSSPSPANGVNGGKNCAACTVTISLLEQFSSIHNESINDCLRRICTFFPVVWMRNGCSLLQTLLGPFIGWLSNHTSPDFVCQKLKFCSNTAKPYCHLFRVPKEGFENTLPGINEESRKLNFDQSILGLDICSIPGINQICKIIKKLRKHYPLVDLDKDFFSTIKTLRGDSWRGKDCNDFDNTVHPGARPVHSDVYSDSNCNGIHGVDPTTDTPYEDLLCKDSQPRGIAILGDSIAAHFHLPSEWFTASKLSVEAFKHVLFVLENEFDWPELSSVTGYMNSTWTELEQGVTDSIYLHLKNRNRCNHRDYQNIGVNGARSSSIIDTVKTLARNQTSDLPLLLFLNIVGNDVCNHYPDTVKHMTTPKQMKANILKTLQYLDTVLPTGSNVVIFDLPDGRVLFDTMHDRIHPIGSLRNDVTYSDVYDYLNCLQISPCTGWMNTNQTIRKLTFEHMQALNNVLYNIYKNNNNFKNFHLYYYTKIFEKTIHFWEKQGGQTWQLIEPVDGFHNNQLAQKLASRIMWKTFEDKFTSLIGPVNPNNEKIKAVFGDQGGYN